MSCLLRAIKQGFCKGKPPVQPKDVANRFTYLLNHLSIKLQREVPQVQENNVDQQGEKQLDKGQHLSPDSTEVKQLQDGEYGKTKDQSKQKSGQFKWQPKKGAKDGIKLKKIKDVKSFQNPAGQIAAAFYLKYKEAQQKAQRQAKNAMKNYVKGEKYVERKPIDPKYTFKISRLITLFERQKEDIKERLDLDQLLKDPAEVAQKIREHRDEIEQVEQEGDAAAFWQAVAKYPGSRIGPLPEDDPQTFYKYIKSRIPASVREMFRRQTGQSFQTAEQQPDLKQDEMTLQQQKHKMAASERRSSVTFRDTLSQNRLDQSYLNQKWTFACTGQTFVVEKDNLPNLPDFQLRDYQSNWQPWILWQKFVFYYQAVNWRANVERAFQSFMSLPMRQESRQIGSLYTYYKTLPKFLQQSEAIKTIYLGLEYKCPEWTISEKEQQLNKAAYLCLPLDMASQLLIDQHYSMDKYRLSAYEVDRMLNMKPQFTYEVEDFYSELKQEKLRGERALEDKNLGELQKPPAMASFVEAPHLPVDFYDNDDGFWDNYIVQKTNNYAPTMKGRKYLKH